MDAAVRASVERALESAIRDVRVTSGGDVNEAFIVTLASGARCFVKTQRRAKRDTFEVEARGLTWLSDANALRVPDVLGWSTGADGAAPWLALELIEPAAPAHDHDDQLGRGLAALHAASAPSFGLPYDNYVGALPQVNVSATDEARRDWATFYREQRLVPLARRAHAEGTLSRGVMHKLDLLHAKLPALVGPAEPPSRVHGDLWGGNALVGPAGEPVLIDPAVYGGHREIDLAMMRLFGGFGPRVFAAYEEAMPLAPGARERVALYQLYPLLVHVCMFGASYAAQLERAIARYVS